EAQAREAQIEVALERVRARTMAMHKSEELAETAKLLFNEVQELGIKTWTCGFNIFDPNEPFSTAWVSLLGELRPAFKIPHKVNPSLKRIYNAWKSGESFYQEEIEGEDLKAHTEYMFSIADRDETEKLLIEQGIELPPLLTYEVFNCAYFRHGYMIFITTEIIPGTKSLFQRFAKVFEQTYTRFLDLKQAEAQAREVQIELALERVRAKTMAMQHSDELLEAANILFKQIQALGIPAWSVGYNILAEDKKSITALMSSVGVLQSPLQVPLTEHKSFKPWLRAIREGVTFFTQELDGKEIEDHYKYLSSLPGLADQVDEYEDARIVLPKFQINHLSFFSHGFLMFITYKTVPEAHEIFKRFAKVFEQTYTRFLDLQKAEAQAREAEIEAALERIRSKAMAMHTSDDLISVADTLREQMGKLGQPGLDSSGIHFYDDSKGKIKIWWVYGEFDNPSIELINGFSEVDYDSCQYTTE
ncbi:MAG: hypothetical protein KAQ79_01625, partial [Cyclobacteriaceae bacterium]|nr:hypothetical protein [Cyclobacteriaceae bacterium]